MPELISKSLMMDKQILLGILMGTSHPIIILNKESFIISVSQKAKESLGYHEDDLLENKFLNIIEESYHSSLLSILNNDNIDETLNEENFKFECEILNKSGQLLPVELSLHKIVHDQAINIIVIIKEQSPKNYKNETHEEYVQLFQVLAENSSSLIIIHEADGAITFTNSKVKDFLGYSQEETLKKNLFDFIHPDDHQNFKDSQHQSKDIDARIKDKDDNYEEFSLSFEGILNKENVIVKRLLTVNKKYPTSPGLAETPGDLATLTNILPDIFMKISQEGEILEVYAGDPQDLITSREEILQKNIEQVFPSTVFEILTAAIEDAFEKKEIITCKYELPFPDGQIKHFEARVITITDNSVLTVNRNITEQVKIQQNLIDANEEAQKAAKLKDDFISVMSHEIRTPLNAVIGMTQLLIRKNPNKEQLELLNTIKFSGENLLKIINEILDFSKIKAEKVEFEEIDFNLRKLVKNNRLTHKNLASGKGLKFKLFIDDDVPEWIKGDYTKLNQILNNLISNAIKFTEEGSVSLDIYVHEQTNEQVTLLFEVTDTGIGIPKDKLKHIFDPFHQASSSTSRKFGGTGLGLSIIKNMVELQKGKIEVESEEGKGSVFRVYLTFNKAPDIIYNSSYTQNQQEIVEYKLIDNLKILYVEDVESNQLLMEFLCKEWGVELEVVSNGFEAIEKVQTYKPHLILMDLQMPGLNGYEATEKIRALPDDYYKQLPIIALTAEVSESAKLMIKEVGMNDILLKPIDTDELYEKLSQYSIIHEKRMIEGQRQQLMSSISKYNYVNFSKTEELYKNDPLGFIKLLNLLIREFEGYHVQILKAIKEKDVKGISFVKHKVASTIQSFNLKELADILVKIQHILTHEPNNLNEKELLEECAEYFNVIINEFHLKIKEVGSLAKNE